MIAYVRSLLPFLSARFEKIGRQFFGQKNLQTLVAHGFETFFSIYIKCGKIQLVSQAGYYILSHFLRLYSSKTKITYECSIGNEDSSSKEGFIFYDSIEKVLH